ncbi:MAG TPA: hypothetical protein PLN86_17400 [Candidatus Hydrogenedentes bacterium]|nr:hypothetical protein [Candidatus Hydrogenedentota bacterium]
MMLNVKGSGGSMALGGCKCCVKSRPPNKVVKVEKTFAGACEEVVGELKKFYGEPKMALAEVARAVVKRLGFGKGV